MMQRETYEQARNEGGEIKSTHASRESAILRQIRDLMLEGAYTTRRRFSSQTTQYTVISRWSKNRLH